MPFALTGFHDTTLLLVLLSLVGLGPPLLLRDIPATQPSEKKAATPDNHTIEHSAVEANA